jgi:trehalose 6-phosphate phosphatase
MGGNVGVSGPSSNILAPRNLPVLTGFALSNVLLGFDYDGTLAPIVPTPDHAAMRPHTHRLLARVSRRYPCIVISGRALDDIATRVKRIPLWYVFGNHGLEPASPESVRSGPTADWLRKLRQQLPDHPGVFIEDKKHTVTIHYRAAHDRRRAVAAIDEAVRDLRGARVIGGKDAVNLLPHPGPDKGVALKRAMQRFGCAAAIYVGDDDTYEDAFAAAGPERLLAIRVGSIDRYSAAFHMS